jgi:hypothetical protein
MGCAPSSLNTIDNTVSTSPQKASSQQHGQRSNNVILPLYESISYNAKEPNAYVCSAQVGGPHEYSNGVCMHCDRMEYWEYPGTLSQRQQLDECFYMLSDGQSEIDVWALTGNDKFLAIHTYVLPELFSTPQSITSDGQFPHEISSMVQKITKKEWNAYFFNLRKDSRGTIKQKRMPIEEIINKICNC